MKLWLRKQTGSYAGMLTEPVSPVYKLMQGEKKEGRDEENSECKRGEGKLGTVLHHRPLSAQPSTLVPVSLEDLYLLV